MPFDRKQQEDVNRILGEPDLYPDELLSWMLKKLADNPYFTITQVQLPTPEPAVVVGEAGAPAFNSPWAHYDGGYLRARFWKDPWGNCFLNGLVKATGAVVQGAVIFTLPAGYRPEAHILSAQERDALHTRVDVLSNGNVAYQGPGVASIGYMCINVAWRAFA